MTTAIYFFLMSVTLFIVPQLFVRYLLGNPVWNKNVRYLFYASALPVLWYTFVPNALNSIREINFLQHAIGGGVAVGLVSLYLINVLKEKFTLLGNFPLQIVFVYFLVSGFGVANELLEFLLDFFKVGIFSADRYDVWFDLVANTIGAFSVFFVYKIMSLVSAVTTKKL